ncbi:MAG: hypothetical protein PHG69_06620, partial [Candidatus Omnitrophica bacterium]|nr:hypothetical protein [Candidatus Omnitrophota bacterium]
MKKTNVTKTQRHKVTSQFFLCLCVVCLVSIYPPSAYAMNAANPTARDDAIDATLNGLGGAEQSAELAPIKIKVQDMLSGDEYLLAKAIHLYNQRKLSNAKGDLKEVLIENPKNQTAAIYLNNIVSKIDAAKQPRAVLEEEQRGIASVENAKLGGIYGKEEFGNTDGAEKFTINATGIVTKVNQKGNDLSSNEFVSAAMKLEGSMSDYKYTATADINYYNKSGKREDARLRNATWWMKNEKMQFILGDTSSYLSRYILNGVNYRGVNLKMGLYQNMFGDIKDNITFLYGKVPFFQLSDDKYIYAREIFGARNEMDLWENWEFNTSFAYILDSRSRIIKIDPNNKPKQNAVLGIDQVFRVIPDVWTLYEETALSYADDDRSTDSKILRSAANYFVSDFKTKKFKLYNSYERVEPNFRSFLGLTGYTANNQLTVNREHILNYLEYEPRDEVNLGLQYSRTRTNLN